MEEFFGRKEELNILQSKYDRGTFCMTVLYGRRRIGKTMLVNEFLKHQDCIKISFTAVEQNEKALLQMMQETVLSALAPELSGIMDFPDFDKLFAFIGRNAETKRILFFIDEYPYLAKECPYIQSLLQKHIDTTWKNTDMFFILCGSLIGFMKDEVLAKSAPLYGRSDLELKLRPFDYAETALFLDGCSSEEKAVIYGLTGGVAKYIRQFDKNLSLDENIIRQFFSMGRYFSEEQIKTVITGDRQDPVLYNSIIAAIATGHTKNSEIASCAGNADITYPLKVLVKSEILEKRISKKPYYIMNDSMLEFWFRYVNQATSLINAGNGAEYYYHGVKDKLHDFMGGIFEKMAKEYLFRVSGSFSVPLMTEITDYQTSVPDDMGKLCQIEIDLCGKCSGSIILAGECKFKNEKFGKPELDRFLRKVQLLHWEDKTLCLFSLSGFTEYVREKCGNILLLSLDDLYKL